VRRSRDTTWDDAAIAGHARAFDEATFRERIRREVAELLET
jgi:hypothetical protein